MKNGLRVQSSIIGRENELKQLMRCLDEAVEGGGSAITVSGDAGIGKTRLIEEFLKYAGERGVKVLVGTAAADGVHPFLVFSNALREDMDMPLFQEQEFTSFSKIFAVNESGVLVTETETEDDEELDADIFAGVLSAVQDFIRDSFDNTAQQRGGLGRLEYGDTKVLVEHGDFIFLTGVFRGAEHPDMRNLLKRMVREIEKSGGAECAECAEEKISALTDTKFLVRRDLEGVNLDNERIRIADMVLEQFVRMSLARPLLLILEDLHWADESSLFVLNYLARNLADERILLLATHRPEEGGPLGGAMNDMRREKTIKEMNLDKLADSAVRSMVDEMYSPNEFGSDFIDQLASRCDGNPFFVIEMLRHMHEKGDVRQDGGVFVLVSEDYAIPRSVEDVIQKRLEVLGPDAITMAEYAACIGREFDKNAAFSLQSLQNPPSAFDELLGASIFISSNGKAEFCHAIFQEVIYDIIGPRWKTMYHKSLGEYYEHTGVDDIEAFIYELANHFSKSNERAKAFEYCREAAEKARKEFAMPEAIELYEQALNVSPKEERKILLYGLAEVSAHAAKNELALETYSEIAEIAEDDKELAKVLALSADIHERKANWEEAMKLAEQARDILEPFGPSKELARAYHVMTYSMLRTGQMERAMECEIKQLDVAEKLGDVRTLAHAEHDMGTLQIFMRKFDEAAGPLERAAELRKEAGDMVGLGSTLNNLGAICHHKGELNPALNYYRQALEVKELVGDVFGLGSTLSNLGIIEKTQGNFETALEMQKKSLNIRKRIGDMKGMATCLTSIGLLWMELSEFENAEENLLSSRDIELSLGDRHGIGASYSNLGDLYCEMGRFDVAVDNLEKSMEIAKTLKDDFMLTNCLFTLARTQAAMDKLEDAEKNVERGGKLAKEMDAFGLIAEYHRVSGKIKWRNGDWDGAESDLFLTVKKLIELDDTAGLARAHRELARMYRAKGDDEQAIDSAARSLEIYERMGNKAETKAMREFLPKH